MVRLSTGIYPISYPPRADTNTLEENLSWLLAEADIRQDMSFDC
jgi:hypothetical protein